MGCSNQCLCRDGWTRSRLQAELPTPCVCCSSFVRGRDLEPAVCRPFKVVYATAVVGRSDRGVYMYSGKS